MSLKKVLIMSGPMGAGKSFYAKHYVETHKNTAYISRDNIRFSFLSPEDDYFAKEEETLKEFYRQAQTAINNVDVDAVILDASHLDDKAIAKTLNNLNIPNEFTIIQIRLETSLSKCLEQNGSREGRAKVPEKVIETAYNQFQEGKDNTIPWVRHKIDVVWEIY